MHRAKDARPLQGLVFEDAGTAGSGVAATPSALPTLSSPGLDSAMLNSPVPTSPAPHQPAAASADVICLTDNDQDDPEGSEPVRHSAAQASQALKHPRPRPRQVPAQPKVWWSEPCSSR